MNRALHPNSLAAHDEGATAFSRRAARIYNVLMNAKFPMTDRQVAHELGFSDMNSVRPRITELVADGWCDEVGSVKCAITGKRVRLVAGRATQRPKEPGQLQLL